MRQKVLCPTCGTTSTVSLRPLQPCPACKKRLPLTIPRTPVYIFRTVWRFVGVCLLVVIIAYAAPAFKAYHQSQKINMKLYP